MTRRRFYCLYCDAGDVDPTGEREPDCCTNPMVEVTLAEPDTPESFLEWK